MITVYMTRSVVSNQTVYHQNDISDSSPNSVVIIQLPFSQLGQ